MKIDSLGTIMLNISKQFFQQIRYFFEYIFYCFFYFRPKNVDFPEIKNILLCNGAGISEIEQDFKIIFPETEEKKIKDADLISKHVFDVLGSGSQKVSADGQEYQLINWQSDFKSGFKWNPRTFFRYVRFGDKRGVDIKVPWELSRFHHLHSLGQAYVLTHQSCYAREYVNQIKDWVMQNPVGFGVNWVSPMEASIRAVNLLTSLEYFSQAREVQNREFLGEFYQSICEHGLFIYRHREYSSCLRTNHYLSNLAGLFIISVYCPFFSHSKSWLQFAIRELNQEMVHQIYSDGCDFEASTAYHRLVVEMLFYAELIGKRKGVEIGTFFNEKLKTMFEFILYGIKPKGTIPQIGDNDSGRFLCFNPRSSLDCEYLLLLAAVYYRMNDFKLSGAVFDEEVFWVFGGSGKKIFDELSPRRQERLSRAFSDAGWYVLRHKDIYCFISCGPNGQDGIGGHAHNDKLSFELTINGEDVFVDPGTYVYTAYPEQRNDFRSTGYHNTIVFENIEQNRISDKHMFTLSDRLIRKNIILEENDSTINFSGEIYYAGCSHKRKLVIEKDSSEIKILDVVSPERIKTAKLILHLSPGVIFSEGIIMSKETKQKVLSISAPECYFKIENYDYSPGYGKKINAQRLVISNFTKNLIQISFIV
ncbi:MAG: alginate lyase family protein [Candidatus Omnitrophota bacterium]